MRYNIKMKFKRLSEYLTRIEQTKLRNEIMGILAELIRESESREVEQVINLVLGQLRPKFDRLEFNLAEKMVVRAIAEASGERVGEITKRYKTGGDLGEVIEKLKVKKTRLDNKREDRGVGEVYEELEGIAEEIGQGSQERKVKRLAKLLNTLEPEGRKYVVRVVIGKLRLGFSDKTILDALSFFEFGSKEGRAEVERAYQVFPDVGKIGKWVKEGGVGSLERRAQVKLGTPVMAALAQRLRTAEEMIEKMGEVVVEPKFDGTRVEIHWSRNQEDEEVTQGGQDALFAENKPQEWVKTFTRNLDENTKMFPELEKIGEQIVGEEAILDTEAVGYDPKTGKMVPFQLTITRKRKHGVAVAQTTVPLRFYVFDILYKDGKSLLNRSLIERRKILEETIKKGEVLEIDEAIVTSNAKELREYHTKQLAKGLEGALVKKSQGKYEPGRQGWNWVKFKEEEGEKGKLSDTIDGVVMGYYAGRGKRQKFGLGAFLMGVREGEKILTIAKIGTGLTDQQFEEIYKKLEKLKVEKKETRYLVHKTLEPDVWVKPELVVEVAADEVTNSPTHTSKYALRFPRLVKLREDKNLEEVTSVEEVKEIAGV